MTCSRLFASSASAGLGVLLFVAAVLSSLNVRAAPVLFGATHHGPDGTSTLVRIDTTTGAAVSIGSGIGFERVSGLAFHSTTGVLYGVGERRDGSDTSVLIQLDTFTGIGTEVGPTGIEAFPASGGTGSISDISFRPSDQTLFGWAFPSLDRLGGFFGGLFTVELTSGAATLVGYATGVLADDGSALAFTPGSELLYAAGETPDGSTCTNGLGTPACDPVLHRVNEATAAASLLAILNFPPAPPGVPDVSGPRTSDMDFNPLTGTLFANVKYGFGGSASEFLATVNTTTGDVTLVGPTADGTDALAFVDISENVVLSDPFHFRDHESSNTVGTGVGDNLTFGVTVSPIAGATGSASQNSSVIRLFPFGSALFSEIPYDSSLTGSWTISVSNGADTALIATPAVGNAPLMPFVENPAINGNILSPTVTWTLPTQPAPGESVLPSIDRISVLIWDDLTDTEVFRTSLPASATSVSVPNGLLELGGFYAIRIVLVNGDPGSPVTRSSTWVNHAAFPEDAFADEVVRFAPGANVSAPFDDPTLALGAPDFVPGGAAPRNHMSLGWGGELVLRFTDNALTTSGDATADLHVIEIGPSVEPMEISIGTDGANWIVLGKFSARPTTIDIDSIPGVILGEQYTFVRIVDTDAQLSGSPFGGADIDAVGAISSVKVQPTAAEILPAILNILLDDN